MLVNGRPEVARQAGAEGVQLPEADADVRSAREHLGDQAWIGVSVHSVAAAQAATSTGADFLIAGSVYPSRTHPGAPAGGLPLLKAVIAATPLPVLAIGGIDSRNAAAVMAAGAAGVAVISAILGQPNPEQAARELWEIVRQSGREPLTLTVNGKPRTLPAETPLVGYLKDHGIEPRAVAVEHNGEILRRERFDEVVLRGGDRLEILRMIGGG